MLPCRGPLICLIEGLPVRIKSSRIQPIGSAQSLGRSAIAIVAQNDCGGEGTSNCGLHVTPEGPDIIAPAIPVPETMLQVTGIQL